MDSYHETKPFLCARVMKGVYENFDVNVFPVDNCFLCKVNLDSTDTERYFFEIVLFGCTVVCKYCLGYFMTMIQPGPKTAFEFTLNIHGLTRVHHTYQSIYDHCSILDAENMLYVVEIKWYVNRIESSKRFCSLHQIKNWMQSSEFLNIKSQLQDFEWEPSPQLIEFVKDKIEHKRKKITALSRFIATVETELEDSFEQGSTPRSVEQKPLKQTEQKLMEQTEQKSMEQGYTGEECVKQGMTDIPLDTTKVTNLDQLVPDGWHVLG